MRHVQWPATVIVLLAVGLVPIHGGDATSEKVRYVRSSGDKFTTECKFVIARQESGWTIKGSTDRGTLQMEVETRYDAMDRPTAARAAATTQGKTSTVSVKFKDGKATVERAGHAPVEFDAPGGTIVTSAPDWSDVFLLCRRYDRERKGKQEFPALWIHPTDAPQRLTFSIELQGTDAVVHDGNKVELGRYMLRIRNNSGYLAWADAQGRMVRLIPLPARDASAGLTLEAFEKSAAGLPSERNMRIASLIRQLGHEEFARREAASIELDAIGAPALDALRKAASHDDPEVRRRAEQIVQAITGRIRAAAAKKELAKWQGDWSGTQGEKLAIQRDQWVSSTPTFGPVSGTLKNIDVREKMTLVDLVVEAGPTKGHTAKVIFRIDGDTLHYCGTYDAASPTEFKTGGNSVYIAWKRGKIPPAPAVVPPRDVQYASNEFSTDLLLAESKEAVHRVVLKCRLADGGSATLTLDPNVPRFDEFGDRVAGGKQLPHVILDCTLKLIKKDANRQLFELRGPKIVCRLTLVAYKDIMPWGDGRLLIHGKGGEVKNVIDLYLPEMRVKPCHPGCFPAGTPVRVPDGARPIERIREGDRVTTVDANGKLSSARVTAVFVTRNRLLEVRVEGGKLVTTETQPVGLAEGDFRPAGELKAGDRIWRWVGGERRAVAVLGVTPADREAEVFNLILGEPKGFIAGDFLVRSKPPAALAGASAAAVEAVVPINRGRR